ncbi:MAG: hypothetical protein NTU44_20530 [Bacteroidetes bacterium]|nr:hypothetical protein [Bacteroidota bacterium]
MKRSVIYTFIVSLILLCLPFQHILAQASGPKVHKVIVKEVKQVTGYTYLLVTENNTEQWMAMPKLEAKTGDIFYYNQSMKMTNFPSKELGKTFETIYFLEKISKDSLMATDAIPASTQSMMGNSMGGGNAKPKMTIKREDIKIDPATGGVTIAELMEGLEVYRNKTLTIRAQIIKVSDDIMNRNWLHIQDGTAFEGIFDLTVTTSEKLKAGDIVTLQGKISFNKDFGHGYHYDVIMEDAVVVK